nr:helix-turn-helix domain-containing protein [Bifidobacterium longum]
MTKVYSHLSAEERVRIDELRNREGLGVCQIALRIGRDKSTVSRELRRGLQAIVREINDTPMKVLDWETPNEVWYRELGKLMPKTSHPKTSVALTN